MRNGEGGAIPRYAAHFRRQTILVTATCIAGTTPSEIRRQLAGWEGVVDEVIVRALPAHDTAAETLAILHAVKPS